MFGYGAEEALGRYAARIMVDERYLDLVIKLFSDVMRTGQSWAGAFPIRRKDGGTRLVEFRNMRLTDDRGAVYALGLAVDQSTVRRMERDVALSTRIVSQSPIGLAVLDTGLRYVSVNPALAQINGVPATTIWAARSRGAATAGRRGHPDRGVPGPGHRETGRRPVHDRPDPADPEVDHAWSVSLYRLENALGSVLGVAVSVVDVTEQYRAAMEAETARPSSPTPRYGSAPPWTWSVRPVSWPTWPCRNWPTWRPSTCWTRWSGATAAPSPRPNRR
ncbi:PAS domain-containing protein [Streptomyces sp. INA 01156]